MAASSATLNIQPFVISHCELQGSFLSASAHGHCPLASGPSQRPTKPWPSDYKTVSATVPTFLDALAAKDRLWHAKKCTI